jgi:flagellar biosynthesis protein FlhF
MMRYAVYEGKTKQEAIDKMFMAARLENRVNETMLIRTYPEERRKFWGLKKEVVWIATACIDDEKIMEKEKKGLYGKKNVIQPGLFDENQDIATNSDYSYSLKREVKKPVQPENGVFSSLLEKNKKLEQEVETLKNSLLEIQNYIKTEFEEIKEGLVKNTRNTAMENKRKIMQDLEISQKNIQWAEEFLREKEFHPDVIKDIVEFLNMQKSSLLLNKDNILNLIKDFLKTNIVQEEIMFENYKEGRDIIFIGPTGVGKTVTLIKLAAHLAVIRQKSLRFISIDRYKVGADSQLKAYAEIMSAPFFQIHNREEFFDLLKRDDYDYTFIDTAGKSPKDTIVLKELADWIEKTGKKLDVHLVVSATTKPKDLDMVASGYSLIDYSHIIGTKFDETVHLGSIVSLLYRTKKPISFITNGQGVPEDFEIANVDRIIADSLK